MTTASMPLADTSTLSGRAKDLLSETEKGLGFTPNILKQMANSPAALESFLSAKDALSRGLLSAKMQAFIGIVVAQCYSCEYLLSARVAMAKKAGANEEELRKALDQASSDPKIDQGLGFVRSLLLRHSEVLPSDLVELKAAGYTDGEIVELIANASLNMNVYYLIKIALPALDFEQVKTAFPV